MEHLEALRGLNSKEEKKAYLNSIDFKTMIWKKNDSYYGKIEELGLQEKGSSASELIDLLDKRKNDFLAELVEDNGEDLISYPKLFKITEEDKKRFLFFVAKSFVVALFFALSLIAGIGGVIDKLAYQVDRIDHRLEQTLTPTPQKEAERLQRFKEKVQKFKPYAEIIKSELLTPNTQK